MNQDRGKPLTVELGELKEVIGKLWKSVDSFKIATAETDHKTQEQITTWTQVNLQLLQLLSAKTAETERLAQNYTRLTNTLTKLDAELQQLERQIVALNLSLPRLKPDSQSSGRQEQRLDTLSQRLHHMNSEINDLTKSIESEYRSWIWTYNLVGGGWAFSGLIFVIFKILQWL
jgi:chromosome segregation ATPase